MGPQGAFWAQDLALRSFLASPPKKTLQPQVAWLGPAFLKEPFSSPCHQAGTGLKCHGLVP